MTTHKNHLLFGFICAIIILFCICTFQIDQIQTNNKSTIEKALRQALDRDLFIRLLDPKVKFQASPITAPSNDIPTDGIRFRSETTDTIIPYNEKATREQVHMDNRFIEHSATRMINPIQPERLNDLFVALLDSAGIKAETAIVYLDKKEDKYQYSHPDKSFYRLAIQTETISLGLENEIQVQAYVRFAPHWLFQPNGRFLFYNLLLITILLLFLPIYYFLFSEKKKTINTNKKSIGSIEKLSNGIYQLGKIKLDTVKGLLINDKQSLYIRNRQEYNLLLAFLEAPNRQLRKQEIVELLNKSDCVQSNQLNTIMSRLRKLLKEEEHIHIELSDKTLYTLNYRNASGNGPATASSLR